MKTYYIINFSWMDIILYNIIYYINFAKKSVSIMFILYLNKYRNLLINLLNEFCLFVIDYKI